MTEFPALDDDLLAVLDALYAKHDPVPVEVTAAAGAAGALIPAAIDWDWLDRLDEPATVRGSSGRLLSFSGLVDVDVELHRDHGVVGVRGLVTPVEGGTRVDVCWPGGRITAGADDCGRFDAVGLPPGPLRLIVRSPGARPAATRWFVA